ncbi:hypothetical protein ENSA5_01180 [Enhygromyxa salina]|uniref:PIN domain-containing protein n=1 Tax=Enhygromyxa salina TaxID=215803 RepID=A0A2S9YL58_9BACT|nr:hypothetical protein [Enhygromyxa salina]PRQ05798.1 hypothetical protein ENSA5_01180 [Enhygromyxa salina]
MIWLLDSGPLDRLAQIAEPTWPWPGSLLHVAEMVAWEQRDNTRVHRLLSHQTPANEAWIARHELPIGSPAERMYSTYLRPRRERATRDAGEDASIALCALALTDACFVVADGRAALWAMIELGVGRVASEFDCWKWLHDQGHVSRDDFRRLCTRTQRALSSDPEHRARIPARFVED